MQDRLGGFIAEVEGGAGLQAVDPEIMRYEKLCNEAQLDIDKEVPPPPVAIYIGDSPACTFGNFSASIGKPKGKKTFNVSAMTTAAMTNSTILNYRGNMPSNQNGILYFDTDGKYVIMPNTIGRRDCTDWHTQRDTACHQERSLSTAGFLTVYISACQSPRCFMATSSRTPLIIFHRIFSTSTTLAR